MLDAVGNRTLSHLLAEQVAEHGERTFLVFEDAAGAVTEETYREFAARVERCARGLADLGVGHGDYVVVHLRNCPEILVAWFALARLGAVFVPSNVANTAPELEHLLETTGARLAVTEPALLEPLERAIAATDTAIVVARGDASGHASFADLLAAEGEPPEVAVASDDVAELLFTSGTTRKPKAVMLTHANCLWSGQHTVQVLWMEAGERCLTALPMFHVNAQANSALAAMTVGGTLILLEEFRASRFWSQVRAHGATQTALVAMQVRTLLAQPPDAADRDHGVKRLYFAINVTDREKDEFEERFGVSLINSYGLSEAMVVVISSPVAGPRRWPSIGLPSPGRRVSLVDEDGRDVPVGQVGEIVVHGVPGRDIMLGYLGDEEATAAALRDGRLHTGDNAYADAEGYLYFFDRKKDMIKRAGENVSALEVEAALLDHPGIAEACVIGVPDAIRDEAVAAVVVAAEPGSLTEDEVVEHCRGCLAKFKVPTVVRFVDHMPRTSIEKIRKDELRKEVLIANG